MGQQQSGSLFLELRVEALSPEDDWRCNMSAVLELERVQPILVVVVPTIVVPRDHVDDRLGGIYHRCTENAPLGIVGGPHVDLATAGSRLPKPGRPQRHILPVRSRTLA